MVEDVEDAHADPQAICRKAGASLDLSHAGSVRRWCAICQAFLPALRILRGGGARIDLARAPSAPYDAG
jgi:hypothetical protein